MDSPRFVQPMSGSIPSKQVSDVLVAQVAVSTKRTPPVHTLSLLDSGANSCFMDRNFAQAHQISLSNLPCPASVVVIDARPIASGNIIQESEPVNIVLDNLACAVSFNIISIPEHPIVLGLPWLELHNPDIDWRTREIRCRQTQKSIQKMATISNISCVKKGARRRCSFSQYQ